MFNKLYFPSYTKNLKQMEQLINAVKDDNYIKERGIAKIKEEDKWSCVRSPDYWPDITTTMKIAIATIVFT